MIQGTAGQGRNTGAGYDSSSEDTTTDLLLDITWKWTTTGGSGLRCRKELAILERIGLSAGTGGGVSDHGALSGRGDDDHTLYILADGSRALTADWPAGAFEISADVLQVNNDKLYLGGKTSGDVMLHNASGYLSVRPGNDVTAWTDIWCQGFNIVTGGEARYEGRATDYVTYSPEAVLYAIKDGTDLEFWIAAFYGSANQKLGPLGKSIWETSGPGNQTGGDIPDGEFVKRSGTTLIGRTTAEVLGDLSGQAAANFAMNSKKFTGLAAGSGAGDSVRYEQLHPQAHNVASHSDTTGTGAELETLTDGSETTLHSHAVKQRLRLTIENPDGSEDITMGFTEVAITVSEMRAVLIGSSTPSVTWKIRHHSDRNNAGNAVVTAGTTTTSTTTGSDVTSFDDATIPADSFIWLETTAKSGTVTELHVTVVATED